jgi:pyrimidine-nucleoside phosphorylase
MLGVRLGAGRIRQDDVIDFGAGIMFDRNTGDAVKAGEVIARIELGAKSPSPDEVNAAYLAAVTFSDAPPPQSPLVVEHLTAESA